jgi:hypothetical protein
MLVQFINLLPENPGQISVLHTRESQEVQQSLLQFLVGKELVADQGLLEAQALVDEVIKELAGSAVQLL